MKIRILSPLLVVVLALGFVLLAAPAAGATTYTVDDDWQVGTWPYGEDTDGDSDFATIQAAIDAASAGDTIAVAAGTYFELITLKDGVSVIGAGADVTTIDGGESGTVVTASGVGATTRLEGFTITHGHAKNGGGMYNYSASPIVANCCFRDNWGSDRGGGMCNASYSSPMVVGCTFSGNKAGYGGGMGNAKSSPVVTNCTFSANTAANRGGGMYCIYGSAPTITNGIISDNLATSYGGGLYADDASFPVSDYNDVWGNTPDDYYGCPAGTSDISADPLLVNPDSGDGRLGAGSPCLDAGSNSALPAWLTADFEGDPRLADGDGDAIAIVDMGADEYVPSNTPPQAPASPLCGGMTNPTGVTDSHLEFSWTFFDADSGDTQGGYQILVASTPENLAADIGDRWNSGRVDGSLSEAAYTGTALAAEQTYYWKVKTWDDSNAGGPYCDQQQFTTQGEAPAASQTDSSGTTAEAESSGNWFLVGGIIAAVVIIGLAAFFIIRRRKKTVYLWLR